MNELQDEIQKNKGFVTATILILAAVALFAFFTFFSFTHVLLFFVVWQLLIVQRRLDRLAKT